MRQLDHIIPLVYQGLEDGTAHARDYFERQGEKLDPSLAPCLVRYRARLHLEGSGQAAQFRMEDLLNNGLLLNNDEYRIRILKADHGDVPAPGPSRARQRFWSQNWLQLMLPFDLGLPFLRREPINLLLVWDVIPRYNLAELVLACPKKGDANPSATEMYWTETVPHPAERMPSTSASADGNDIEDLDISLPDEDEDEEDENRAAQ